MARFFAALFFVSMTCGCSSLLYYPDGHTYVDAKKLPVPPEDVNFESEDKTRLHGWYFKTSKRPPKGTVIHFHGNAQNLSAHFAFFYWLVEQGYDYFIFDYRGYGQSEAKSPSPEGTVRDGRAALRWIALNKDPKAPLYVLGQSLGGAVALRVAGEMATEVDYAAVIVDSAFHSYQAAGRKALASGWLTWLFQPLSYILLSDRYAPREFIAKISPKPLLVIHGTKDRAVNFSLGEAVYCHAAEPRDFWEIDGGRHTDFVYRPGRREDLVQWMEKAAQRP